MESIRIEHNTLSDVRVLTVQFELGRETIEYEVFSNDCGFIRVWDGADKKYISRTSDYRTAYITVGTVIRGIFGDIDFEKLLKDDYDFGITYRANESACYISDYDSVKTVSLAELKRQVKTAYYKEV